MIVRNEAESLAACLDSVKDHVDEIVLVLAGESTDATEEICRRYTDKVYHFEWCDDFAAARNYSFSFCTGDYYFWLDGDDLVRGAENLHQAVEDAEQRGIGCLHLVYEYRHDSQGKPIVTQTRERLMKRDLGWNWLGRVHEYCAASSPHTVGLDDSIVVVHTQEEPESERNLRLLLMMEEEDPNDPRLLASLADYYQSSKEWERSIAYNTRAVELIDNPDVKWTCATELARSNQALGRWDEVEHWCLSAMAMHPEYSLPYLLMAHSAWFGNQDAQRAMLYLADADRRLEAPLTTFRQPEDYTFRRWDVEHRILADLGRWQDALAVVGVALEAAAGNKERYAQFSYFGFFYKEHVNTERSLAALQALSDHFCQRGDTLHALHLLEDSVPVPLREDPRYLKLLARVREITAHTRNDEAYANFYNEMHNSLTDVNHAVNATESEPYRMEPLIARLKARGAKRVLDVGCGAGAPALELAKAGFYVTGIDINKAAIKEAKKQAKKAFGNKSFKLQFRQGSLDTLGPDELGHFDAVVMMEIIEHLTPQRVPFYLGSAEDCLSPGGAVFITTPAMMCGDLSPVWQDGYRDHVWEWTDTELNKLIFGLPGPRYRRPMNVHRIIDPACPLPGFASWFVEYEVMPARPETTEWDQPVVIYAGPGLEAWTPDMPETEGLGGSETWASKVALELRLLGHPVIVYAMCDGVWDGVIYRNWKRFNRALPFAGAPAWLCIVSRYLEILDERPNAERVLFVAHDVDYGAELTPKRLANMDEYCVMSQWQLQHTERLIVNYDPLDPTAGVKLENLGFVNLRVIANGIEPAYFEGEEERQRHRFIYASSFDRGLDVLLDWWPQIRSMWPDAELHCYYGWNNFDALLSERPWLATFRRSVELALRQPGVYDHGRLGQRALAREFMKSHIWLYPCWTIADQPWHETFCITALEAQAAGAIPIIPRSGALPERFYFGRMVDSEKLELADVLDSLQTLDRQWPRPVGDSALVARENTWRKAAELLLVPVASPELALA